LRSSSAGARRDVPRQFQIGSTAHDRHRPVTTHQCCWQLLLLVDRRRACSANDHSRAPAPSAAMSTATRLSLHQAPPPLYPAADPICQSRRLPRSRLPGAFKSIVSARRTVLPHAGPGLSDDACPRSLPHCQVTGRHLITLNDCGFWGRPADVSYWHNPDLQSGLRSGRYRVTTGPSAPPGQHCNSATPGN
jgi:hypothetical protein